jgi:hypothetical protein
MNFRNGSESSTTRIRIVNVSKLHLLRRPDSRVSRLLGQNFMLGNSRRCARAAINPE